MQRRPTTRDKTIQHLSLSTLFMAPYRERTAFLEQRHLAPDKRVALLLVHRTRSPGEPGAAAALLRQSTVPPPSTLSIDETDIDASELIQTAAPRERREALLALSFLTKVRAATAASDPDDGLDMIYREIDALLRRGAFPQVDALLAAVDMTLPTVYLLAFVSITSAAREHLAWDDFLRRVRERLSIVEPDRVEELLRGFE